MSEKKKKRPISFWSKLVAKGMLGAEVQPRIYVSDIIAEFLANEDYDFKDFTNAAPPFPEFWMEGKQGSDAYGFLINAWRVHKDKPDAMILGRLVQTFNSIYNQGEIPRANYEQEKQLAQDILGAISIGCHRYPEVIVDALNMLRPETEEQKVVLPPIDKEMPFNYEWAVSLTLVIGGKHREPFIAANVVFMLDDEGLTPIGKKFSITLMQEPKNHDHVAEIVQSMVALVCYAMSLMNCKNITLQDVVTSPSKHHPKMNRKREIIFKVLMIDQMGKKQRKKSEGEGPKLEKFKRLHVCRGHMADYRKGNGLFGKYKGIFFVPAHVRGTPRDGIVVKDYEFK